MGRKGIVRMSSETVVGCLQFHYGDVKCGAVNGFEKGVFYLPCSTVLMAA